MKPLIHLAHILFLVAQLATSPLPPLESVVVEHIEAVETVTIGEIRGSFQAYFIDRVQGQIRYIDYRWLDEEDSFTVERVAGEWRFEWFDEQDHCYRAVYAGEWLNTYCREVERTPKAQLDEIANGGWWMPSGLEQPKGRWW